MQHVDDAHGFRIWPQSHIPFQIVRDFITVTTSFVFVRIESVSKLGYAGEIAFTVFLGFIVEAVGFFRYKYQMLAYASAAHKENLRDG